MSASKPVAWCWQDKAALRKIRDAFDASNDVCSALSVYLALCEASSDSTTPEFTTTHAWIARLSGASVSTVKKRLHVLAEIGLLEITTPSLRAPSTYKLLPSANGCPTLANGCRALVNARNQAPLATSEERERKEKNPKCSSDEELLLRAMS